MRLEAGMGFIDRATGRVYGDRESTLYRFQVGRCDVCIFVLRSEPRVFMGGGEFGFDSLAREAGAVEVEALAERFGLAELCEVASRMRPSDSGIESELSASSPRPRD